MRQGWANTSAKAATPQCSARVSDMHAAFIGCSRDGRSCHDMGSGWTEQDCAKGGLWLVAAQVQVAPQNRLAVVNDLSNEQGVKPQCSRLQLCSSRNGNSFPRLSHGPVVGSKRPARRPVKDPQPDALGFEVRKKSRREVNRH